MSAAPPKVQSSTVNRQPPLDPSIPPLSVAQPALSEAEESLRLSISPSLRHSVSFSANLAQNPPPTNTNLTHPKSATTLNLLTQCPGPP